MTFRKLRNVGAAALLLLPFSVMAETTEVGTERSETLIVDMLNGTVTNYCRVHS